MRFLVMSPRLEDRIQALCAKLLAMPESDLELGPTIEELRAALKEHIHKMRERVDVFPVHDRRTSAAD